MIEAKELLHLLREKNWVAQTNNAGMWMVGPETEEGLINVLGLGATFLEAVEMARRSV
jgi:hypothetical protein